jgi:hypothetical protein
MTRSCVSRAFRQRPGPAAIGCSFAWLLCVLSAACGPQIVPYPKGPRPGGAGQTAPEAGRAGSASDAGSGGTRAGSGGSGRGGAAAEGGNDAPPRGGDGEAGTSGGGAVFDAGSDPNRNQVQPGMLCDRLAVIQCAAEAYCCDAPGRSVEDCQRTISSACATDLFLDQIAAKPSTGFDAPAAAAAYTELERRSSECDLGIAAWGLTALRGILKGTLAPNQSCKPQGTAAITDRQAQATALASCTNIEQYACLPMSLLGDWTCAPKNARGGSCVTEDNCQPNLYCRNPNMAPLGQCEERLADGAACTNPTDCASLYCKGGRCVAVDQQVAFCLE